MRSRVRRWVAAAPLASRLGTAGLLLAAFALALPWYGVATVDGVNDWRNDYSLTEKALHNRDGTTRLFPLDVPACECPEVAKVFVLVQLLAWTGAAVAAGAFWAREGRVRPPQGAATALTAAAGLLLAAGPILLALNAPSAFLADGEHVSNVVPIGRWGAGFIGTHTESVSATSAWGPGPGWFAALAAGALTLAAVTRPRNPAAAALDTAPAVARAVPPLVSAPPASPLPAEAAARENAFVPPSG